jgi:hypothetical protein
MLNLLTVLPEEYAMICSHRFGSNKEIYTLRHDNEYLFPHFQPKETFPKS